MNGSIFFYFFFQYLFTQGSYDKPFFATYFKTSLFTIYLSAFIFWRPWQRLCVCGQRKSKKGVKGVNSDKDRSHHISPHEISPPEILSRVQPEIPKRGENSCSNETGNLCGIQQYQGGKKLLKFEHLYPSLQSCPIPKHDVCLLVCKCIISLKCLEKGN